MIALFQNTAENEEEVASKTAKEQKKTLKLNMAAKLLKII